ncbi:hypothetical protein GH733_016205, partial [Mirounga leonina]
MTQRIGLLFCCLTRGLPCRPLFLLGVTCHAVVGCSLLPGLEGSARLWHLSSNVSHYELGSCETEAKLALSLDFWTLSSENLIAVLPVDPVKENYVRKVKNCIFSIAFPTPFKSRVRLVAVSKEVLEDILDLDLSVSETDDFIQLASGEKIVFGSVPLAHRYGGHQFGIWAGQLGDGRAHLLGIYMNRNGDGRAVLHSSVREFLCSEAMHSLGIPTSRAASLVVSDDEVWRDQFYNGNVVKERDFVPNTSDDERRYKIGNQANVGMFNLNKLLQTLNPLLDPRQKQLAAQILEGYPVLYYTRFRDLFKAKLGLLGERKGDDDLIAFLLHQFWALKMISEHKLFPAWVSQYLLRLKSNTNDSDSERRKRMTIYHVTSHLVWKRKKWKLVLSTVWILTRSKMFRQYVLKNWMAESAVRKAERNDFSEVCLLQHVLQHPFQKHSAAEKAGYSSPTPSWAKDLRVDCQSILASRQMQREIQQLESETVFHHRNRKVECQHKESNNVCKERDKEASKILKVMGVEMENISKINNTLEGPRLLKAISKGQ